MTYAPSSKTLGVLLASAALPASAAGQLRLHAGRGLSHGPDELYVELKDSQEQTLTSTTTSKSSFGWKATGSEELGFDLSVGKLKVFEVGGNLSAKVSLEQAGTYASD